LPRTAALLVIGNEILSGRVADRNSPLLARELRDLGVELRRVLVVPDERQAIVDGVRWLAPAHDWVFTSGGVGPTHDDLTLEAVAAALGRPLARDPTLEQLVRGWYDVERSPHALRMADLPAGATLIHHPDLKVPVVTVDNLFVLPGVPAIFERKVRALRDRLRDAPFFLREVRVGAGEVEIAAALFDVAARFPGVALGSYPQADDPTCRVRLTLEGRDRELVERALGELLRALPPGAVRRPG
jgi:molybdenum cofactor synthesis domain-containing protein